MLIDKRWKRVLVAVVLTFMAFMMIVPMAFATTSGYPGRTAYVSNEDGDREIYSQASDGTDRLKITDNTSEDVDPAYGKGGKIAFVSNRDGNDEIYVADADGSNVVRFTNYSGWDYKPTFSPDGNTLTWVRQPNSGDSELVSMSVSTPEPTGTPTSVTSNTEMDDNPSYAQDGRLVWDRTINLGQKRLVIKELNGTNTAMSTQGSCDEWNPDFKPDGTRIAYTKCNSNSADVMSIKPDGTDRQFAAASSGKDWQPAYSADGSYLTWSSNYDKEEVAVGTDLNVLTQSTSSVWEDFTGMSNTYDEQLPANAPLDPAQVVVYETVSTPNYTSGTEDVEVSFERLDGNSSATYQCRIDGGSWSSCTSPKTYTGLTLGVQHTVGVKSTLGGVTSGEKTATWTSETSEPAEPTVAPSPSPSPIASAVQPQQSQNAAFGFLAPLKSVLGLLLPDAAVAAVHHGQQLVTWDGHTAKVSSPWGPGVHDSNGQVPERMQVVSGADQLGWTDGGNSKKIKYDEKEMNAKGATGCTWDELMRHERGHARGFTHTYGTYPDGDGVKESGENPTHQPPYATYGCHYPGQHGQY